MNLPNYYPKRQRHTVPKFEHVSEDDVFAITIAPDDDWQYFKKTDRLKVFKDKFRTFLTFTIKQYAQLELFVEVSSNGRLHYHGVINIRDKMGFYLYAVPALEEQSTVCIKAASEMHEWYAYCTKQRLQGFKVERIPYIVSKTKGMTEKNPDTGGFFEIEPRRQSRPEEMSEPNICEDSEFDPYL